MNKRLEMLEKLTQRGGADSFAWYGLAMEYRKLGRVDDALNTFTTLRAQDPDYLAMYLMAGQMLGEAQRSDEAKVWLEQGLAVAQKKGDHKAKSEIQDALGQL
jgi:predicted Zn-dependent protease